MNTPTVTDLRVLHLVEDPRDTELIARALADINPSWTVHTVAAEEEYTSALDSFAPGVILVSDPLSQLESMDALKLAQHRRPGSPFLILGAECNPRALECLKAGAADFVRTSELARLGPAIVAALDARSPLRKLSNRQLEVLQLLSSGRSTRNIAERLNLSVKTVETHRAQVMKRLGIRELAGLVRYSIYVGLVSAA
jgi:DNA-binding NarL/FixJ family response regulator